MAESTKTFFSKQYSGFANEKKSHMQAANNGDYGVPKPNQDLWKQFGCDTEAGRMLRSLYRQPGQTGEVSQVRIRSTQQSKFTKTKAEEKEKAERAAKKCPQRDGQVKVPRVGQRKGGSPKPMQTRGKKTLDAIIQETKNYDEGWRPIPPVKKGRNQDDAKDRLANKFTYGNAYMNPTELAHRRLKRDAEADSFARAHNGLQHADVQLLEDLKRDIQEKEDQLAEIDSRVARVGPPPNQRAWKERVQEDKMALQLEQDLQQDKRDLMRFKMLQGIPNSPDNFED